MSEFLKFVSEVFEVDVREIDESTEYGVFTKWDSLMHMRLIMSVEEEYNVEIPFNEIANIKTLKDLYSYIQG